MNTPPGNVLKQTAAAQVSVEYKDDLNTMNWWIYEVMTGDGTLLPCLVPMTNSAQPFFRVRMP